MNAEQIAARVDAEMYRFVGSADSNVNVHWRERLREVVTETVRAVEERRDAIDAAEMFGELLGRYRDHWPAICESRGLPDCDISFTSLTAVLDTLVESAKAGA